MQNTHLIILTDDKTMIPIYILISIIVLALIVIITLLLVRNTYTVKKDEVITIKNEQFGYFQVFEKGRHFTNPFIKYEVKRIKTTVQEVNGEFMKFHFFIKFQIVNFYNYSKYKTTFTEELTKIEKNKITTLELAVEAIQTIAKQMGVELIELTYVE